LLVDADGRAIRLAWTGEKEDGERARALPAGEYTLRTYRILREAHGELWHVSATAPRIRTLAVHAGHDLALELDATIRVQAKTKGDQAQMTIQGEHGAGLSIYRAGKRIPIGYRVVDDTGVEVASGSMRYG